MRIIAGSARGIRLATPKGIQVRPTLDRVRESLFNILSSRLAGARFLDLYAGTGANGIEALSRGAACSVFIDHDKRSISLIQENLVRAKLADSGRCIHAALPGILAKRMSLREPPFDIIFADPPYSLLDFYPLLDALHTGGVVADGGCIVIEHDAGQEPPAEHADFHCFRRARYGQTSLSFFS